MIVYVVAPYVSRVTTYLQPAFWLKYTSSSITVWMCGAAVADLVRHNCDTTKRHKCVLAPVIFLGNGRTKTMTDTRVA